MKLSVSLSEADVRFLDEYAQKEGIESRSAVLHRAVRLLHSADLGRAYELAWQDWGRRGDAQSWDAAAADGLDQ